ncbi:MAG: permease prefix domain 1-containing protein [Bacteroidota bacterium]
MSKTEAAFDLETQIRSWSDCLRARGNFAETDLTELEHHLRDEIEDLIQAGLAADEAFLISVKRLGNTDSLSREYSKVNTENLWRQLLLDRDPGARATTRREIGLVILFALLAGTLAKIPELFGFGVFNPENMFYLKNLSLFVLPLMALYFFSKRKPGWRLSLACLGVFLLAAFLVNLYPFRAPGATELLTGIHLPIFLWLITGLAYAGAAWQSSARRMDFIRFTGEAFIYAVLIGCGVVVLTGFTVMIFSAIKVDLERFVQEYLIVYGVFAVPFIAVYLVEAKKSIVENFAPVLAKIFSPLFFGTMTSFLAVMLIQGKSPFVDRNFLIGFDLMLALVLGLVLYIVSSRDPHETPGVFDYLNLALIVVALIVDGIALSAIVFRLSSYGVSPNKLAALGENIILFINLAGLAAHYLRYLIEREGFARLERWQTRYLGLYLVWTAVVAFLFPVFFGFV